MILISLVSLYPYIKLTVNYNIASIRFCFHQYAKPFICRTKRIMWTVWRGNVEKLNNKIHVRFFLDKEYVVVIEHRGGTPDYYVATDENGADVSDIVRQYALLNCKISDKHLTPADMKLNKLKIMTSEFETKVFEKDEKIVW